MRYGRIAASLGASIAVISALLAAGSSTAGADTANYTADGTFTVPSGVTTISVVAVGAAGGSCGSGALSGAGGIVSADIVVTPGQVLTIKVGGRGGGPGGAGGANGGGTGGDVGAGGGGGTDIRRGPGRRVTTIADTA